ncbi:MAG: response regulator transcription factor [Acidimicrobiia bacterium]|nr:response regulator transcription factor [Acidimicrobiia bacterium]
MPTPIRVVIADDHELVREGTRQLLANHDDIEVVAVAADGVACIEEIRRSRPDVALVDISMPGMSGIEVTAQTSVEFPAVAVLVLTVHDEQEYVTALLEAGAAGYLLKDIGEADLVRSIREVHAGESVLHPDVTKSLFAALASNGDDTPDATMPLTDREMEVLKLAGAGSSNREIAVSLDLSPRTVQAHLRNIFEKLEVASRTQAVITGLRDGWLELDELG